MHATTLSEAIHESTSSSFIFLTTVHSTHTMGFSLRRTPSANRSLLRPQVFFEKPSGSLTHSSPQSLHSSSSGRSESRGTRRHFTRHRACHFHHLSIVRAHMGPSKSPSPSSCLLFRSSDSCDLCSALISPKRRCTSSSFFSIVTRLVSCLEQGLPVTSCLEQGFLVPCLEQGLPMSSIPFSSSGNNRRKTWPSPPTNPPHALGAPPWHETRAPTRLET